MDNSYLYRYGLLSGYHWVIIGLSLGYPKIEYDQV